MAFHIDLKVGLRLLVVVQLLIFAHKAVGGSVVPAGNGSGVPPATTAPGWTETSSVPQLSTDTWCNNNPCLNAAEPSVYRSGELGHSGSNTDTKMAEDVVKDVVLDEIGKKVSPAGSTAYKVITSPVLTGLEAAGAIGAAAAAGLGVFFAPTKLGNGELPPKLRQQRDAKQQEFDKISQQNKQEAERKVEENRQTSAAPQESENIYDALNIFVNTAAQIQQMEEQTNVSAPQTAGGCHSGHDEGAHPGGCHDGSYSGQ